MRLRSCLIRPSGNNTNTLLKKHRAFPVLFLFPVEMCGRFCYNKRNVLLVEKEVAFSTNQRRNVEKPTHIYQHKNG